jgi:hypothetical protein
MTNGKCSVSAQNPSIVNYICYASDSNLVSCNTDVFSEIIRLELVSLKSHTLLPLYGILLVCQNILY